MPDVRNRLTGRQFFVDALLWTRGDTDGLTPLEECLPVEVLERYAYPDAGLYGDRQPWAFDPDGGEDGLGCFVPVEIVRR